MVSVLPLDLPGKKWLTQTKMSSCLLFVCPFVIRLSIHPVAPKACRELWIYLKEDMYSTLACTSPFSSVYSLLCCAAPHFCFLSPYNIHMHPHSLSFRFVAPSSERLFGTEHFFPGSVLVSKTMWEAVHNGSVALPSVTLSSLSKVRLVSRVHHHSPH